MAQIPAAITTLCQVSMEPERELVTQAGERTFAIYSPEVFTAHGHCTNGTLVQRYISHTTTLSLDSGCSLELRQHILTVPFSIVTPRQPIMEYTNWDTLEVPKQVLLNMDRNEMRMYDFLPADHNLSVQVDDGIRMSQTQLAVLHHRLSQQVEEAHNNGFWITVAVSILLGFLFTVITYLVCSRYFCPKPVVPILPFHQGPKIAPQGYFINEDLDPSPIPMRERRHSSISLPSRETSF